MHDELTKEDLRLMRQELETLRAQLPALIQEVTRTRAFGDLSENFEYKAAKQAQNQCKSRIRYLEGMIKTAHLIRDEAGTDQAGLYDKVEIWMPERKLSRTIQVVTTVRVDPRLGLVSRESPLGKAVLGHRVGDRVHVQLAEGSGYDIEIRSITKSQDDGSAPLMGY